jgi:hypothetical protein
MHCLLQTSGEQTLRTGSSEKKRRRGQSATDGGASISQEETDRRNRQRQLRELAIKLRAEGKEYKAKKYRYSKELSLNLRDGHKPRRSVQVIIVPIFWNRRESEKESVLEAAAAAQTALRAAGIKADTDTTHKLTPGQKFRHWEEKGVKFRVEIGPQEAESGTCMFASCSNPGQVAIKEKVTIGQTLVEKACRALGMKTSVTVSVGVLQGEKELVAQEGLATEAKRSGLKPAKEQQDYKINEIPGDNLVVNTDSAAVAVFKSGDDLDGDFELIPSGDADADASMRKSKKSKNNIPDKAGNVKKSKIKVVKF